jgi:hypothetical protein
MIETRQTISEGRALIAPTTFRGTAGTARAPRGCLRAGSPARGRWRRDIGSTSPIKLGQRDPAGALLVGVLLLSGVALAVDRLVEHVSEHARVLVVVVPDLAEECVCEAHEERRAQRDPLAPPCAREKCVEPNLIVEENRQATELEAGVRGVLDARQRQLVIRSSPCLNTTSRRVPIGITPLRIETDCVSVTNGGGGFASDAALSASLGC